MKRPHTQFTWVNCSLPLKTGKFTPVYAANTWRRIHANCLQPHVNSPEYNGYFTGNFTCRTHSNLPATRMQNCLLLHENVPAFAGKNTSNLQAKALATLLTTSYFYFFLTYISLENQLQCTNTAVSFRRKTIILLGWIIFINFAFILAQDSYRLLIALRC